MMFWITSILILISLIYWIYLAWDDFYYTLFGGIFGTIGQVIVGVFAWFLISVFAVGGLGIAFAGDFEKEGTPYSKDLVALQTKDTTEGEFSGGIFASYGYIKGQQVISYISKSNDGGMKLGHVDVDEATVYEEADAKPKIVTQKWSKSNEFWWPFGTITTAYTYDFHVPEGSVSRNFEVAP